MTPTFKLYPDLLRPRIGYILADLGILLWVVLWIYVGNIVYNAVMTLVVFGRTAIAIGHQTHDAIAQVQHAVAGIPLGIGGLLHDSLNPLYGIPGNLITAGQNEVSAVEHLALVLGVIVAIVPLLAGLLTYIPWRVRKTRGFRSLNRVLRQPGATSASTTMHVLAARALYTLPYAHLLQYSRDPIGEWREGRYYNLARATLEAEGLELHRYLRRVEGLAPLPEPHNMGAIGDES
jgi:hypothetical protein